MVALAYAFAYACGLDKPNNDVAPASQRPHRLFVG
jgi:hypothetical protein